MMSARLCRTSGMLTKQQQTTASDYYFFSNGVNLARRFLRLLRALRRASSVQVSGEEYR
jgi:hypothetical protein